VAVWRRFFSSLGAQSGREMAQRFSIPKLHSGSLADGSPAAGTVRPVLVVSSPGGCKVVKGSAITV
jgi:hypothetical protein